MRNPFRRQPEPAAAPEQRAILDLPWDFARRTASGEAVSRSSALHLPPVWRSVSLVAELLSSLPVDVYRGTGADRVPVAQPSPIVTQPSLRMTRREWVFQYVAAMMLDGNAYGVVLSVNPTTLLPETVEWVDNAAVSVDCANSLALPTYRLSGVEIPRERLIHVRNFTMPGCIEGLSPIEHHAETLGLSLAARKFGAQWFGDGAHPSAILSTEQRLTPEQAKAMKQGFMASLRGRREPAVLGSDIKYTPIQISPEQSQFLQTIQANVNDIAQIFGVPVEMIGGSPAGSSITYANREQRWLDFIATCLNHYAVRLEDALTAMTVRGQAVKFNMDALLRGDTMQRYQAHALGLTSGFLQMNEVRALENRTALPELPEADPEVTAALNLVTQAPSLVQNPGLPALVDQLRALNGKPPLFPQAAPPAAAPADGGPADAA